ncbi:hypothetical protein M378DRAFT_442197 [Amanita muscaria Koide BX008]|uniref:Uncharacterized protein n=1 Tax=Amanita muscaria (strain Koide BX008) TaxID=946122 RepID=A0A0C2XAK8_AMAMK|nr:hypothetical protein M378DRAFT_442197 [Amanita muscaria Koide BX008]
MQNGAVPLLCNGTLRYPCYGFTGTSLYQLFLPRMLSQIRYLFISCIGSFLIALLLRMRLRLGMRQCLAVQILKKYNDKSNDKCPATSAKFANRIAIAYC